MHPPKFEIISGATLGEPNAYAFFTENTRVLLDCGVDDKRPFDACFLSHAHLDHAEALEKIAASGNILSSSLTISGIQDTGRRALCAYIESDNIVPFLFQKNYEIGDISITPFHSGHIPGAAMFLLKACDKRVLYTSDFCLHALPQVPALEIDGLPRSLDLLVCETTLSNFKTEENDVAIHREKLEMFCKPNDGPSLIVTRRLGDLNLVLESAKDFRLHENIGGKLTHQDATLLLKSTNRIIVGGSLAKGSASAQLVEHALSNPKARIALINGVQRTKEGVALLRTKRRSRFEWGYFRGRLRAHISSISLRNHVNRDDIIFFIETLKPKRVALVHGPDSGRYAIAKKLKKLGFAVDVPKGKITYEI